MITRATLLASAVLCVGATIAPSAQGPRQGPPPEVRALFDALTAAINADSADGWEAFAQERFTPAHLQRQSRDDRARIYRQIVDRFGTIALGGVMRRGPDAPLRMNVKGSRASGAIVLGLDDGPPPRIADLQLDDDATAANDPNRLPISGSMSRDELGRRLDAYFTGLAAGDRFSGVALVAHNGEPVFFKAYGLADRERKVANTVTTRFNIGSINKTFTQAAIRQLVDAGKLSYSDTLGKFFPDYPQAVSRAATIEQLLTMRGGVADVFGEAFARAPKSQFTSNADYFAFVSRQPPVFAPGERSQYCNGCYIALGEIIAKASGMPYERYVAQHVFARAAMTATGYPRSDRPEPGIANGYTRQGGGPWRNNIELHGVTGSAAGGGYSTASDLLAYVKAIRAGSFPGANQEMGIGGGAPGINAVVETSGPWVVIVLANLDPPAASQPGSAIAEALQR